MKILVILASTRPTRLGERVAKWATAAAQAETKFDVELVDLKEYNLPFFDEEGSPRYNPSRTPVPEAKRWLAKLAEADGYIVVTPEYNFAIPGALKNAFDYIDHQITKKPVAIVSYGAVGGARAAEQLKLLIVASAAAVVPRTLTLTNASEVLDEEGSYVVERVPYGPHQIMSMLLVDLTWWTNTLAAGRK